jgi:hypothetical protein
MAPQSLLYTGIMDTKTVRKEFTKAFQEAYINWYGFKPDGEAYRELTNTVYLYTLGGDADTLKELLGVPEGDRLRDYLNPEQMEMVCWAEKALTYLFQKGYTKEKALSALWHEIRKHTSQA